MAEFRKTRLNQLDPFPDMSARATGHALNHAIQAYRITGDQSLLTLLGSYISSQVLSRQNSLGAYDGQPNGQVASWQTGYLLRSVIDYLEELPGGSPASRDSDAYQFIENSILWNIDIGNFATWRDATESTPGVSNGTGLTLVDPQRWYAVQAGSTAAAAHADDFVDGGINGGAGPYGDFDGWEGSFEGRITGNDIDDGLPDLSIVNDRWHQISLPCDPGNGVTVSQLFGDDELGVYGDSWIIWEYDTASNNYENVGAEGAMLPGKGYWFIQKTGSTRTLTLPSSCGDAPLTPSADCSAGEGCFNVALQTGATPPSWNMIGLPFDAPVSASGIRVSTSGGTCTDGCSLPDAETGNYLQNRFWSFNGTGYDAIDDSDSFAPWAGYWAATLSAAPGNNPELVVPGD